MHHTVSGAKVTSPGLAQNLESYLRRLLEGIGEQQSAPAEAGKGAGAPQKLPSAALWTALVLGTGRAQARYAVRLVRWRVGVRWYTYLSNVLEPQVLPLAEIARLYARRWDMELAFLTLKEHLGLHLLWTSKLVSILQQVWACLIIAQVLQALRLEIACGAGVDPLRSPCPYWRRPCRPCWCAVRR